MASPTILDMLGHIRAGHLLVDLQDELAEVVRAVDSTGKPGTLTLQLKIKKISRSGALEILDKIVAKAPEEAPLTTLMYSTPEGRLTPSDPRQSALDLKLLPEQAGGTPLRSIGGQ